MLMGRHRRLFLALAGALALTPFLAGADAGKPTPLRNFTGKVVPLADVAAKHGMTLDKDASPYWLVLVTDDGKVLPLVKDGGSRLFFRDKALLNRPMRLTGRLLPGSQLLRVSLVRSIKDGKLYEIYYWCDVCSIRRGEKLSSCECCGGPMKLVEEPVKE
jgi:hypothetical protein